MFTSLILGAALTAPGAPVPRDTVPPPTGPAPQVAFLRADANGQVWVQALTYQKVKQTYTVVVNENGKQVQKQEEREVTVPMYSRKQLGDLGAKFATADGMELTAADALKRVKDGAPALVSADGKPIQKAWLKAVDPETVVIAAEGLAGASIQNTAPQPPSTLAPRLVLLAADMEGKLRLAYNPNAGGFDDGIYYGRARGFVAVNGLVQPGFIQNEFGPVPPAAPGTAPVKPLEEVKFDAYDLSGKTVAREEALKRLKAGGMVLIAGDNRVPDAAYLKLFRGELLVLVSNELVGVPNGVGVPSAAPGVRPALPIAPAAGGAVVAPAIAVPVKPLAPAVAAPAIKPAAAPAPKPVEDKPTKEEKKDEKVPEKLLTK